jgi:hypothetical protein
MSENNTREYFLNCIITTAVEGGTGYWAVVHEYKPSDEGQGYAVLQEFDEATGDGIGNKMRLDHDAVEEGLWRITHGKTDLSDKLVAAVAGWSATNDLIEIDADAADIITQVALLGQVVYG